MNLYFQLEFRMCSLSFLSIAPSLNFNIAYVGSVEFQMETYIITHRVSIFRPPDLVIGDFA